MASNTPGAGAPQQQQQPPHQQPTPQGYTPTQVGDTCHVCITQGLWQCNYRTNKPCNFCAALGRQCQPSRQTIESYATMIAQQRSRPVVFPAFPGPNPPRQNPTPAQAPVFAQPAQQQPPPPPSANPPPQYGYGGRGRRGNCGRRSYNSDPWAGYGNATNWLNSLTMAEYQELERAMSHMARSFTSSDRSKRKRDPEDDDLYAENQALKRRIAENDREIADQRRGAYGAHGQQSYSTAPRTDPRPVKQEPDQETDEVSIKEESTDESDDNSFMRRDRQKPHQYQKKHPGGRDGRGCKDDQGSYRGGRGGRGGGHGRGGYGGGGYGGASSVWT